MSAPHADRDHSEAECCSHPRSHPEPCDCPCTACGHERKRRAGTSRSVSAREVRASEAQVEAAWDARVEHEITVKGHCMCGDDLTRDGFWRHQASAVADAVVAAGEDADEVTRLRSWKAEATEVISGLQDLGKALGLPLGERITGSGAAEFAKALRAEVERLTQKVATLDPLVDSESRRADRWKRLAEAERQVSRDYNEEIVAAHAERDRLAEVVARVEALADERDVLYPPRFGRTPSENYVMGYRAARADLCAALSGPTPAETPQNGPEPALSREQGTSGQSGEGEALRGAEKGEEAGR